EARSSLVIRTDQLKTIGSAQLNITGTLNNPDLNGRISLEGGTIKFRGHKYEITTGTIDLPGGASSVPYLTLLAEGDIRGYHVSVGFTGPVNELDVSLR